MSPWLWPGSYGFTFWHQQGTYAQMTLLIDKHHCLFSVSESINIWFLIFYQNIWFLVLQNVASVCRKSLDRWPIQKSRTPSVWGTWFGEQGHKPHCRGPGLHGKDKEIASLSWQSKFNKIHSLSSFLLDLKMHWVSKRHMIFSCSSFLPFWLTWNFGSGLLKYISYHDIKWIPFTCLCGRWKW